MKAFFLIFMITFSAFSQEEMQENLKDRFRSGGLNLNSSNAGIIYGFDNSKSEIIGNAYYTMRWTKSNIKFYPITLKSMNGDAKLDTASNLECKFNMLDNIIEAIVGGQLKGIDIDMVKALKMNQATFVNIKEFKQDKIKKGLLEEIINGKFGLYAYYQIFVKKPDFNAALNTGTKDVRILKDKKYFLKNGQILSIITNKKSLEEALGTKFESANKYLKENEISLKEEGQLKNFVKFLNEK